MNESIDYSEQNEPENAVLKASEMEVMRGLGRDGSRYDASAYKILEAEAAENQLGNTQKFSSSNYSSDLAIGQ